MENGSWAPMATKIMRSTLEECKELEFTDANVKIFSSVSEGNIEEIKNLANEISK